MRHFSHLKIQAWQSIWELNRNRILILATTVYHNFLPVQIEKESSLSSLTATVFILNPFSQNNFNCLASQRSFRWIKQNCLHLYNLICRIGWVWMIFGFPWHRKWAPSLLIFSTRLPLSLCVLAVRTSPSCLSGPRMEPRAECAESTGSLSSCTHCGWRFFSISATKCLPDTYWGTSGRFSVRNFKGSRNMFR